MCPQIKTKQTVFNYTSHFHKYRKDWTKAETLDPSKLSLLKSAAHICKVVPPGLIQIGSLTTNKSIYTNLRQMAPQVSDLFHRCEFNGRKTTNCSKWFQEIWTEEGVCYTFNMLNTSELYRPHK